MPVSRWAWSLLWPCLLGAAAPDDGYPGEEAARPPQRAFVPPRPVVPPRAAPRPRPAPRRAHVPVAGAAAAAADDADDDDVEIIDAAAPAHTLRQDFYGETYPSMDRGLDHLNAHTLRRRTFSTLISHRNREGVLRAPFDSLLGFDGGGLKIVLGLRYAFLDDLDVGFVRQNGTWETFDTWEFDVRYRLLRQQSGRPFDLAVRAGLDWYHEPRRDALAGIVQVLVSRLIADRALLSGGVLFASNSSGPTKANVDARTSTALMLQAEFRALENLALDVEYTQNIAGFHERYPIIAFGPKIVSNRHTFSFVFANSQYMTGDSLVTNSYFIGAREWVMGFHITREIDL